MLDVVESSFSIKMFLSRLISGVHNFDLGCIELLPYDSRIWCLIYIYDFTRKHVDLFIGLFLFRSFYLVCVILVLNLYILVWNQISMPCLWLDVDFCDFDLYSSMLAYHIGLMLILISLMNCSTEQLTKFN